MERLRKSKHNVEGGHLLSSRRNDHGHTQQSSITMKSLPDDFPFVGTYKRYKKKTDDIARYLEKAAHDIGYKFPRKATTAKPDSTTNDTCRCRLRTTEFVPIAKAIKDAPPPPVEVPIWLIPAIEDTVDLRKRFAGFYQATGDSSLNDDTLLAANQTHEYFVGVLEKVRDILKPLTYKATCKSTGAMSHKELTGEEKLEDLHTRMNRVDIARYLSDEDLDKPSETEPESEEEEAGHDDDEDGWEMDEEAEVEEFMLQLFPVFCLFEDLNTIRDYISTVWQKYKNGNEDGTDLMTASMVTNTAMDLIKRIESDFRKSFPSFEEDPDICENLFLALCALSGVDPSKTEEPKDFYNMKMKHVARRLFYDTFLCLDVLLNTMELSSGGAVFATIPEKPYNLSEDRSAMTDREKLMEDFLILSDVLPEFTQMEFGTCHIGGPRALWADEVTNAIVDIFTTGMVSLHSVFAAQIYLDITHILRERLSEGFEEMQRTGMTVKVALAISLRDTAAFPTKMWPQRQTDASRGMMRHIDKYILGDMSKQVRIFWHEDEEEKKKASKPKKVRNKKGAAKKKEEPEKELRPYEPFYLFKRHPLYCGTVRFAITLLIRKTGTKLAFAYGSLAHLAHLYNDLRESGELDVAWPDMDRMLEIHTEQEIFFGKRPRSKAACEESYTKMTDMEAAGGKMEYNQFSAIIHTFGERYFQKDGEMEWNVDKVEKIIQAAIPGRKQRKKKISRDGMSVVALLNALKAVMAEESPKLRFDYMSMHRRCLRTLTLVRDKMHEMGPRYVTTWCEENTKLHQGDEVCGIAGWLIYSAADIERDPLARMYRWHGGYDNVFFIAAADILRKIIDKEGSVEINKLEKGL